MLLYHGTTTTKLPGILRDGLRPRLRRPSNWDRFQSRPDMVYLTTAYPLYFAQMAGEGDFVILEVETKSLENSLYPDEDFIAQVVSQQQKVGLDKIHPQIRKELKKYKQFWRESLENMGTCCHKGIISPVTQWSLKAGRMWSWTLCSPQSV